MAFTKRGENNLKAVRLRNQGIKLVTKKPVIKNVDVEEIKRQFAANLAAEEKPSKKSHKAAEPVAEVVAENPVVEALPSAPEATETVS